MSQSKTEVITKIPTSPHELLSLALAMKLYYGNPRLFLVNFVVHVSVTTIIKGPEIVSDVAGALNYQSFR